MRRRWVAPLLIGVPILLAACDRSEADARAHLTAEGMRDVVLTHLVDEGSFHYTANRGDSRCAGNIHFQKDHRGTAIHDEVSCMPTEESCRDGIAQACFRLGRIYLSDDRDELMPTERDPKRAASYMQRACNLDHAAGCNELGVMQAHGEGLDKSLGDARASFERSCDAKHARGCFNLGIVYHHGQGVAAAPDKAAPLYRHACRDGVAAACNNLGVLERDGVGVPASHLEAAASFELACRGDHYVGCANLGDLYRQGVTGFPQPKRAAAAYRKACSGGVEPACAKVAVAE